MTGLNWQTLDPLVRRTCEEAVRCRLRQIEAQHYDDRRRLAAKRASLDLLHFSVAEGRVVDPLQIRLLLELLDAQERERQGRKLPPWPGAQYGFLSEQLDLEYALGEARRTLREALEAQTASRAGQ
jgi:hypothetical protein